MFLVVNHIWICFLCPTPGKLVKFLWKNANDNWNFDTLCTEKIILTFPIETEPGNCRVSQPGKRNVVEDIIPSKAGRFSFKYTCDHSQTRLVVIKEYTGKAKGGIGCSHQG